MGHTAARKPVNRLAALEMFLEAVNARSLRTFEDGAYRIEVYAAHGRQFIVQKLKHRQSGAIEGFEVFIPSCDQNSIAATLDAARDYIVSGTAKRAGPISPGELTEIGERITLDQLDELKGMFP